MSPNSPNTQGAPHSYDNPTAEIFVIPAAGGAATRIRATLGATVSLPTFLANPTVADLAPRLDDAADPLEALGVLVGLRTKGARPPLFCVHPAIGLSWCYTGLLQHLGPDRPLYGVQAVGLAHPDPLPTTIEQAAATYLEHIRSVQPAGPYHLLGWSYGGLVAHAAATRLQREGEEVALLAILDAYPVTGAHVEILDEWDAIDFLIQVVDGTAESVKGLSLVSAIGAAMDLFRRQGSPLAVLDEHHIMAITDILNNNVRLMPRFTPSVFRGPVTLFTADVDMTGGTPDPSLWRPYVDGTIEVHHAGGQHRHLAQPAPLARIGAVLSTKLRPSGEL